MRDQVYVPRVSLIYNGPSDNWGDIKSFQNDDGSGVYIKFLYNEAWSNKITLHEIQPAVVYHYIYIFDLVSPNNWNNDKSLCF